MHDDMLHKEVKVDWLDFKYSQRMVGIRVPRFQIFMSWTWNVSEMWYESWIHFVRKEGWDNDVIGEELNQFLYAKFVFPPQMLVCYDLPLNLITLICSIVLGDVISRAICIRVPRARDLYPEQFVLELSPECTWSIYSDTNYSGNQRTGWEITAST